MMKKNPPDFLYKKQSHRPLLGFTLMELLLVILILAMLSAVAIPTYVYLSRQARVASITALAGNVSSAMHLVRLSAIVNNMRGQAQGTVMLLVGSVYVRIWNGWPDRWWDGIGISLGGATPTSGGYLSTTPFRYQSFVFYGFGNNVLPNNLSGWLIPTAPTPRNCSVTYANDGTGNIPLVQIYTSGC